MKKNSVLLLLMFIGVSLIQCDTEKDDIKQTPTPEILHGVWRSENNDSIKFINPSSVYINSILHHYIVEYDSLKLAGLCNDLYCSDWLPSGTTQYGSYKYTFDTESNKLVIYDFYNTYDSIYYLHNSESSAFFRTNEEIVLPFEEWIQGRWINQVDKGLLFSRPYLINDILSEIDTSKDFFKYGLYFGGNGAGSLYVFTNDSLRLHSSISSYFWSYSPYKYEIDRVEDCLIILNYCAIDTSRFFKE